MLHHDPNPYRWQDHVITPRRAAANLMATVLIVLAVTAAAMLADPPHPATAHTVAANRMPSLSQHTKQPAPPRGTGSLL
jgi:hypothetical protein